MDWTYITLREDRLDAEPWTVGSPPLTKGIVLRVYEGEKDVAVIQANGKKVTKKLVSPNNAGYYLVETPPDAKSRFWNAYPGQPQYEYLVEGDEYKSTLDERSKHLYNLKLNMEDGSETLLSNALANQYDNMQVDPQGNKLTVGSGGGAGEGEDGGSGKKVLLYVIFGIVAAYLIYQYTQKQKQIAKQALKESQ